MNRRNFLSAALACVAGLLGPAPARRSHYLTVNWASERSGARPKLPHPGPGAMVRYGDLVLDRVKIGQTVAVLSPDGLTVRYRCTGSYRYVASERTRLPLAITPVAERDGVTILNVKLS